MALQFYDNPSTLTVGTITYKATYVGDIKKEFWNQLKNATVQRSARAKELIELALKSKEVLHIIGDLEQAAAQGGAGYAAFGSPDSFTHVMVWDPALSLPFDAGGVWTPVVGWKDGTKQETGETVYRGGTATQMPTYITILHELGHFEQYLQKKDWYLAQTEKQRTATNPMQKTACTSDIEADNLKRNEKLICQQLGLPERQTYFDTKGKKLLTQDYAKFT